MILDIHRSANILVKQPGHDAPIHAAGTHSKHRNIGLPPESGRRQAVVHTSALAMCGRLPVGKGCFDGNAKLVGAAMCPALYEADLVKAVRPAPKQAVEPGVSRR